MIVRAAIASERDPIATVLWEDDRVWAERLRRDAQFASRRQTPNLRAITNDLLGRAVHAGARSFALTGSTAVDRRTRISDLDFYVIGDRPDIPFTDEEIDVFAVGVEEFERRLNLGDDYLHWTLRFGLILYDSGPLRSALTRTARESLWPDPEVKAVQARRAAEMAAAILQTGDWGAAVEQCRVAFSLAARWWLLEAGEFPRARRDLPDQLRRTPLAWLGDALEATIFEAPQECELDAALQRLHGVLAARARSSFSD